MTAGGPTEPKALGAGSIVLGLALQDTLGSLMSGIALLFERPFQIGDWIKAGGNEGAVIEVNWRSVPDVLSEPPPKVEVMEFGEDRIGYEAKLYMTHLRGIPKIRSEFATRAWYAAQRAGLALPVPVRTLHVAEASASRRSEPAAEALRSLVGFASLDDAARKTLSEGARLLHYAAGETALAQEPCGALCLVSEGLARMSLRTKAGDEREVMELRAGEAFGEGALLKGERSPVTVTALGDLTVVALDTAALESVLESNPALATEVGQLVESRRRVVHGVKHASGTDGGPDLQSAPLSGPAGRIAGRSASR